MKTVVLSGYYGYDNIGDEALLASIVKALRAELPDLRIIVLSACPRQTGARYDVEAVPRFNPLAVLAALVRGDLLISGGGSLLQDVTGPLTIPYYLGVAAMAMMLGKPVMFYAQGIGPVNGSLGRLLIRLVADRVDLITLRDAASGQLLRELGVTRPPVEVTADPVFGLDTGECHEAEEYHEAGGHSYHETSGCFEAGGYSEIAGRPETGVYPKARGYSETGDPYPALGLTPPAGPVAGIFVREWQGLSGYKKAVAGLADYLREKRWQVVFIPMQYPEDIAPAREIAGMMTDMPLLIEQRISLTQLTGLVSTMDMVIGMRLHALIIAAVRAVPMAGLSYDPKVAEFLEFIGQPAVKDLASVTSGQLIQAVEDIIANRETIRRKLLDLRTGLRQKALRNSRLAAELLTRAGK